MDDDDAYRDDHAAAIARAEALETELARSERERRQLEARLEALDRGRLLAEIATRGEEVGALRAEVAGLRAAVPASAPAEWTLVERRLRSIAGRMVRAKVALAIVAASALILPIVLASRGRAGLAIVLFTFLALVVGGVALVRTTSRWRCPRCREPLEIAAALAILDTRECPRCHVRFGAG